MPAIDLNRADYWQILPAQVNDAPQYTRYNYTVAGRFWDMRYLAILNRCVQQVNDMPNGYNNNDKPPQHRHAKNIK